MIYRKGANSGGSYVSENGLPTWNRDAILTTVYDSIVQILFTIVLFTKSQGL